MNTIIAFGPPPLSQEAADCSIDLIDFMAAAVRGVDQIDVTPTVRESWRQHLAAYYPMLHPADRYWFATAPYTLAAINNGWPQLSEPERDMYRQAWAAALPSMLQLINPVLNAPEPTHAPPPSPIYWQPADQTRMYPEQHADDTMSDLMNQLLEKQRKEEEMAMKFGDPTYQEQVRMQNQATNMQLLSNMSQMRFQTMMAVAKNFKA